MLPKACGAEDLERQRKLAAIIEMLHTATLVHDDVVDESGLRRGRPTANATWNNQTAVLVGDFLISRAFDLLVDLNDLVLLKDFSTGTCEIAEGEVLQLQAQHQPDTTEQIYLDIIHGKTSRLFELATEGAAILTGTPQYREPLRVFAGHFGNAFQIIDDILDYTSDAETLGKNIGDDLMEGKPTLPLISALQEIPLAKNIKLFVAVLPLVVLNRPRTGDCHCTILWRARLLPPTCHRRNQKPLFNALEALPESRISSGLKEFGPTWPYTAFNNGFKIVYLPMHINFNDLFLKMQEQLDTPIKLFWMNIC